MTIRTRLRHLEKRRGGGMPEVVTVTMDAGRVSSCITRPELIGADEAALNEFESGRDVLLVKIIYASQDLPENITTGV